MRPKLTYSNVVATLALFIALGGTTVAATKIDGKTIKRGSLPGAALKKASVPGPKLRNDTVAGRQIRESSLTRVPSAAVAARASTADSATRADTAGAAQSATTAQSATIATTATTAANASNAALLGGLTPAQLTDRCPPGTRAYAGACFEALARTAATWPAAAEICGDAGRRLPSLDELEGFRREPGVVLGSPEHTSAYLDVNHIAAGGEFTVGLYDNGGLTSGFDYGASSAAFRCVAPRTNG